MKTMKYLDPMGGYLRGMHINWGFLSGRVTVWGCNLRELISGVILHAPSSNPTVAQQHYCEKSVNNAFFT